jgi:transposase
MRRREAEEAVRMAKFLTLLHRWESAGLNQAEAAELLEADVRTFRRWTRRYEEDGEAGLLDRRLGKASGRRVPVDRAEDVERLYRERYQGFTVKHFHEHLIKDHGFGWGYTWTKLHLQWTGLAPKAPRKGAHRRKRERRPLPGMMLHQDGSRHAWLEGEPALDLIVTLDDATGTIYSAFLVEEEGTASTFRGVARRRWPVKPGRDGKAPIPNSALIDLLTPFQRAKDVDRRVKLGHDAHRAAALI